MKPAAACGEHRETECKSTKRKLEPGALKERGEEYWGRFEHSLEAFYLRIALQGGQLHGGRCSAVLRPPSAAIVPGATAPLPPRWLEWDRFRWRTGLRGLTCRRSWCRRCSPPGHNC